MSRSVNNASRKASKKRSGRTLCAAGIALLLLAWGSAGKHDQQDRESMNEVFTAAYRNSIVATWPETIPVSKISHKGELAQR